MRACTRVKKKNMHISAYTEKMNQIFTTRESCAEQPDGRRPGAKGGFSPYTSDPRRAAFRVNSTAVLSLSLSLSTVRRIRDEPFPISCEIFKKK